jgi:glycine betaine/proline transport system substrate-binding protein
MRSLTISGKLMALVLVVGVLTAGCGGSSASTGGTLAIGYVQWDENVAVSNLTKLLLEEELGYESVELRLVKTDPEALGQLFEGVASGELDAFQDVWLPNLKKHMARVEGEIEHLDPWYKGATRFSMAAPGYMEIGSIDEINATGATRIYGIEPSSVIMHRIPERTIPEYGLDQQLVTSSTPAMLSVVDRLYHDREDFVFVAWSPHWMNQAYDFTYLKDPKGTLGNLTQPAEISSIVNKDLESNDPAAHALLDALTLTEDQLNQLELEIRRANNDPVEGSRRWIEDNRDVVQPWISAAKRAQES